MSRVYKILVYSYQMSPEQLEKIIKLSIYKFVISSLDYEDKNGTIENFTRALNLLTTVKQT